jgi:hypothetical protein
MPILARLKPPDEVPTQKIDNVPIRIIVILARVERLTNEALERLQVEHDELTTTDIANLLVEMRELVGQVTQ